MSNSKQNTLQFHPYNPQLERQCMFCGIETRRREPEEHIVPHALGNNDASLIFSNGEVCSNCNNRLSSKDEGLANALLPFRAMAGVISRNGVASWTGRDFDLRMKNGNEIVASFDNTESPVINPGGVKKKRGKRAKSITPQTQHYDDKSTHVEWGTSISFDSGLSRGLHKIGLEFALKSEMLSLEQILSEDYAPLRAYILGTTTKEKERPYIVLSPEVFHPERLHQSHCGVECLEDRESGLFCCFTFVGLTFLISLTPMKGKQNVLAYFERMRLGLKQSRILCNSMVAFITNGRGRVKELLYSRKAHPCGGLVAVAETLDRTWELTILNGLNPQRDDKATLANLLEVYFSLRRGGERALDLAVSKYSNNQPMGCKRGDIKAGKKALRKHMQNPHCKELDKLRRSSSENSRDIARAFARKLNAKEVAFYQGKLLTALEDASSVCSLLLPKEANLNFRSPWLAAQAR